MSDRTEETRLLRPEEVRRTVHGGMFYVTFYGKFEGDDVCMVISTMEALDRAIDYYNRCRAASPHIRLLVSVPYGDSDTPKQATVNDLMDIRDVFNPVGSVDNVYS